MANDELIHYGILGMKWGRRKNPSAESIKTKTLLKTKSVDEMSNEEIRAVTTRLQLEKSYKDLTKKKRSAGEKIAMEIAGRLAGEALNAYLTRMANKDPNFQQFKTVFDTIRQNSKKS